MSIEATKQALEPCPFCGGNARFDHDDNGWHWIECGRCGASTNARVSAMDDCKPLLAEQWNKRQAIAEAEKQEPALYVYVNELNEHVFSSKRWDGAAREGFREVFLCEGSRRVQFPTMLRKMWSGGEVQAWLDENVNKDGT